MSASPGHRVLVVGDQHAECDTYAERLRTRGYRVQLVRGVAGACVMLRTTDFDAVLADLPAADADALAVVRAARRSTPPARVIVLLPSVPSGAEPALSVLSAQAFACLRHPVDIEHVERVVGDACEEVQEELARLEEHRRSPFRDRADIIRALREWSACLADVAGAGRGPAESAEALTRGFVAVSGALEAWAVWWDGPAADPDHVAHASRANGTAEAGSVPSGVAREARMAGRPLVRPAGPEDACFLACPVAFAGGASVVLVARLRGREPAAEFVSLIAGAAIHLALALRVEVLVGRAGDATEDAVRATLGALSLRDPLAELHAERVAEYALDLALALGVEPGGEQARTLRYAALLHDAGMLAVPDAVLRKPGPLDEDEWPLLHRGPEAGAALLGRVPALAPAAEVVRTMRERWDGRGYPAGLAAQAIPRPARILAVADSWHAMTSDRPYRRAVAPVEAAEEIRRQAGSQFDPRVVEAFDAAAADWVQRAGEEQGARRAA